MPANRRCTPRCLCDLEAKVLGPRGALRAVVENLSAGGLLFTGKETLAAGQSADFEFTISGASMGLKFTRLEPTALAVIQAFAERSPKAPDLTEGT